MNAEMVQNERHVGQRAVQKAYANHYSTYLAVSIRVRCVRRCSPWPRVIARWYALSEFFRGNITLHFKECEHAHQARIVNTFKEGF